MRMWSLRVVYLVAAAVVLATIIAAPSRAAEESEPDKVLRHVVLFKFNDSSTEADIKKVTDAFAALQGKIDLIRDFEWGTDVSVENRTKGFTHCFIATFNSPEDRDAYLVHPDHKDFGSIVGPHLADVLVVDFWAEK